MAKYKPIILLLLLHYILPSQNHRTLENHSRVNLDSGLVLYYPFNGNARDASGNGNHGMVIGVSWVADRFENPRSAAYFDGIDDFIRVPFSSDFDFSETKQISAGFWSDTIGIGFGKSDQDFNFSFSIGGQPIITEISGSFYWIRILYKPQYVREWHQYFFTADDHFLSFWIDDTLIERRAVYNVRWNKIGLTDIFIGGGAAENIDIGELQNGILDEIRIYNRVLNDEEIKRLYNNNN
ncbi:MAG: hypothetical protein JXL67_04345 [Calditrichaeota bacterium]|nr:hypothetical protein [Calditrichota bacterium]